MRSEEAFDKDDAVARAVRRNVADAISRIAVPHATDRIEEMT